MDNKNRTGEARVEIDGKKYKREEVQMTISGVFHVAFLAIKKKLHLSTESENEEMGKLVEIMHEITKEDK